MASAVTPSGGRLAGRYDLGMLCVAAGERAGFDALDTNWKVACEIAAENGREMDRSRLRCVVNMHLADTREQAIADIRYGCEEFIRYFNNNQPRFHVPDGADYVDWVIEHNIAVVGTPDDAIRRIERLYQKQGEFGCRPAPDHQLGRLAGPEALRRAVRPVRDPALLRGQSQPDRLVPTGLTANQDELVTKRVNAAKQMFAKHAAERAGRDQAQPDEVQSSFLS